MEEPKYILKFTDAVCVSKNESTPFIIVKWLMFFSIIGIIIGYFLFQEFLFSDKAAVFWVCFICMGVYLKKYGGNEWKEFEAQLLFYDDYMIHHIPYVYYDKKCQLQETTKIYYEDVKECTYTTRTQQIFIFGDVEYTVYDFLKDGTIKKDPSNDHRTIIDGGIVFYTRYDPTVDFLNIFETYTPLSFIEKDI